MSAEQKNLWLYVDAYGIEYRFIRFVENKTTGKDMVLLALNVEGDAPWYVVDKEDFERNFVRV